MEVVKRSENTKSFRSFFVSHSLIPKHFDMLIQHQKNQLNTYSDLYDLIIPKEQLLRRLIIQNRRYNATYLKSAIIGGKHLFLQF